MKYWNSHPDLIRRMAYYTITCQNCGEEFRCYGNAHRNSAAAYAMTHIEREASTMM